MPKAGVTHDVVLKTPSGGTKLGISLFRESSEISGGYTRQDIELNPERVAGTEQASYADVEPSTDLVYEQTSWHRGLGQGTAVRRGDDDFRYGCGDGVLAVFEGSLISSYLEDEMDLIVRNGRFEFDAGAATGWVGTNATLAENTANPRTSKKALQITIGSNDGFAGQVYGGTGSVLTGITITFTAYVLRSSGTGNMLLRITGDSSGDTDSSSSTSGAYTAISVTKTLTSDTTFTIKLVGSVASDVWLVDDVAAAPAGGSAFTDVLVEHNGDGFIPYGRGVYQFSEDDDAFYPVYMDAAFNVECLRELDGRMFIGFGANQTYKSSANGTTWITASNASGNTGHASFFGVVRNANGDLALLKIIGVLASLNSGDQTDCNLWGADISIGSSDKAVNRIVEGNDTSYVGKTEGLYAYDRSQQRFRNLAPEAARFTSDTNFQAAIARGSRIYTNLGGQSFWAMTDNGEGRATDWEELSNLVKSSNYEGFSGEVEAIADDLTSIWVALADNVERGFPYTFPITFGGGTGGINSAARIAVIRRSDREDERSGSLISHTVTTVTMTTVNELSRFNFGALSQSMFIFGSFTNVTTGVTEPRVVRLRLPTDNENPMRSASPEVRKTGLICGQWVDHFYPDVEKALAKVTIQSKNLSAARTVTVAYKIDDASVEDDTGWTLLGVANTSPIQVLSASITTPITFKRLRLRLSFSTDTSGQPLEVTGIIIHSLFNDSAHDQWTIQTKRRETRRRGRSLKARRQSGLSATDRSTLDTLQAEPFLVLEDVDGSSPTVKIRTVKDDYIARNSRGNRPGKPEKVSVTTIRLNEVRRT